MPLGTFTMDLSAALKASQLAQASRRRKRSRKPATLHATEDPASGPPQVTQPKKNAWFSKDKKTKAAEFLGGSRQGQIDGEPQKAKASTRHQSWRRDSLSGDERGYSSSTQSEESCEATPSGPRRSLTRRSESAAWYQQPWERPSYNESNVLFITPSSQQIIFNCNAQNIPNVDRAASWNTRGLPVEIPAEKYGFIFAPSSTIEQRELECW